MNRKIALIRGDGIGPEVVEQARLRQPTLYRVAKALGLPKEEGWPKGIEELEQRLGGGQI